jgi:hypothetical protein
MTTHRQQLIMLSEEGYTNPDPRKIFIDDMIQVIREYDNDTNNYTILMFDANEKLKRF